MFAFSKQIELLIIGHSHTGCLRRATSVTPESSIKFIARHEIEESGTDLDNIGEWPKAWKAHKPKWVCLCLGGNFHNTIGLVEHPDPFSVGEFEQGAVPRGHERWFIPYSAMRALFELRMGKHLKSIEPIYALYKGASRLYLNPPPPLANWDHVKNNPGGFKDNIHLGLAPNDLRLQLYKIQTEMLRKYAENQGATFITCPDSVKDEQGFLLAEFCQDDPTHGNQEYGAVMLKEIQSHMAGNK